MKDKKETPSDSAKSSGVNGIMINKDTDFNQAMADDIRKHSAESKAIKFPIDIFPPIFKDVILATFETLNFPIDYSAAAILTAVATTIGKTALIEVKSGWQEFCPLYMNLLGNPGAMKSHPVDMFFAIIKAIDHEQYKKFNTLQSSYDEYQLLSKAEKSKEEKQEEPTLVKTIMGNFSAEILAKRINDNNRSVCVVSEELETWLLGMNNYSKSDQSSTYLSMWSVKRTDVDRVSHHKKPLIIERPFLCIIGTSQPRKLKVMFPTDKCDSGFLQRFLWAFPLQSQKQCINEKELDPIYLESYNRWIREYFELYKPRTFPDGQPNAKIYKFSTKAKTIFLEWQSANTTKANDAGDSLLSEEYNKFDIHFIRFALIMQIMEDSTSDCININATENAIKLCAYFENTMLRVLNIIEQHTELDLLKVALYLVKKGMPQLEAAKYSGVSQATISRHLSKKPTNNSA